MAASQKCLAMKNWNAMSDRYTTKGPNAMNVTSDRSVMIDSSGFASADCYPPMHPNSSPVAKPETNPDPLALGGFPNSSCLRQ
jgi:hypothetical protein